MKIRGTDFVAFLVSDLGRAAAFYRETLGLEQTDYRQDWHWAEFDAGNVTLTLYGEPEPPNPTNGGRIALAVEDIHEAHEEMKRKGVKIRRPPFELTYCWHLEICDPDDNVIILHRRKDGSVGQEAPQ